MGHGPFNSKEIYFLLITSLIECTKELAKTAAKIYKKTRQSSKTGIPDFKLECAKTFLMKFCWHGSNFRRKFQAVLEYGFRESDQNTPLHPLRYLKMKD